MWVIPLLVKFLNEHHPKTKEYKLYFFKVSKQLLLMKQVNVFRENIKRKEYSQFQDLK